MASDIESLGAHIDATPAGTAPASTWRPSPPSCRPPWLSSATWSPSGFRAGRAGAPARPHPRLPGGQPAAAGRTGPLRRFRCRVRRRPYGHVLGARPPRSSASPAPTSPASTRPGTAPTTPSWSDRRHHARGRLRLGGEDLRRLESPRNAPAPPADRRAPGQAPGDRHRPARHGQAAVDLYLPAIRRTDPRYYQVLVANGVLGGGYSARLNEEVRVKRGLSYGANATLDARRGVGPIAAAAQTKNESAARSPTSCCSRWRASRPTRRTRRNCGAQGHPRGRLRPQRRHHRRPGLLPLGPGQPGRRPERDQPLFAERAGRHRRPGEGHGGEVLDPPAPPSSSLATPRPSAPLKANTPRPRSSRRIS
ncbi:MAG: insulinase family protein [Caulobacteraceae bacterium]